MTHIQLEESSDGKGGAVLQDVCLYHGRRCHSAFQHLCNVLQSLGWKRNHLLCLGRWVCTCREVDSPVEMQQFNPASEHHWPDEIARVLTSPPLSQAAKMPNSSLSRLLFALQKALSNEWDWFAPSGKSGSTLHPAMAETNLVFPDAARFHHRCVGRLIGKKGRNIAALEKKLNCKFKLKCSDGGVTITAVYPWNQPELFVTARARLLQEMEKIMIDVEKMIMKQQAYYKMRAAESKAGRQQESGFLSAKESNQISFEKKSAYHEKSGGSWPGKPMPEVKASHGQHCLKCLGELETVVEKGGESCRHHPGFICPQHLRMKSSTLLHPWTETKQKEEVLPGGEGPLLWSCCELETSSRHATAADHATTGCCVGAHAWRWRKTSGSGSGPRHAAGSSKKTSGSETGSKHVAAGSKKAARADNYEDEILEARLEATSL